MTSDPSEMSKSRAYCFTINNYESSEEESVRTLFSSARYGICGREVGQQGTPHLQGYVLFSFSRSFNTVKKALPRAHIEHAKGSPQQNVDYCSKGGNYFEVGERPKQGQRNDVEHALAVLKETSSMVAVVREVSSYQALRVAEIYLKYTEEPRNWKPEVRWYYGPTGSGKTRAAREWLGDRVYTCLENNRFWEGYDGHECVLIDDFRSDFCRFSTLLRMLDRYEYRVEVKGSSRQLRARKIAITCPCHPRTVYDTHEDVGQLLRRIDVIYRVSSIGLQVDDTM